MPVQVLYDRRAVLQLAPLFEQFAEQCSQPAATHLLEHFLHPRVSRFKPPCVVLLLHSGADLSRLQLADLRALAFYFEYRFFGFHTRAFSTDDISGFRSIIAPAGLRAQVVARATEELIARGAHVVLTSWHRTAKDVHEPGPMLNLPAMEWAERSRIARQRLRLAPTHQQTLASLGKSTRFNLGYYRRRLNRIMPIEFVPNVCEPFTDAQLDALNAASLNPTDAVKWRDRFRAACTLRGGFIVGLRAPGGQWLSLIGGWRHGTTTLLHWQMNIAGYEKSSIGTVMRSYFLEHEATLGTREIIIYGGTMHSLQHSFVEETAFDLVVRRRSLRALLLRLVSRVLQLRAAPGRPANFLATALCCAGLQWHSVLPAQARPAPVVKPDPGKAA